MQINDALITGKERIMLMLRELYFARGYRPFRMSKFEEYDFYARNKDFLISDQVITFTDTDGKLMALKPDVTLSIIKNSREMPFDVQKVCYSENVYRVSRDAGGFKELMQAGVECFGAVGTEEILEVLQLAAESLQQISPDCVLQISSLAIPEVLISEMNLSSRDQRAVLSAMGEKNADAIRKLCPAGEAMELLLKLTELNDPPARAAEKLTALMPKRAACISFAGILNALAETEAGSRVRVDFSLIDDIHYYNDIIFKGFVSGVPAAVLSGGQYDRLMQRLRRRSRAIGFAVYTDMLERMDYSAEPKHVDDWLNIALPKGRLGEKVYAMFAQAGFECPEVLNPGRKLIFENPERRVRYFWVKPSDVAIYVERGAADIGVAGKDILMEYSPDIYELLDLNMGKCRMAVAAPKGFRDDPRRTLRVATKFSAIAAKYYRSQGRDIDMIHLNGSIELAPILGLSDVIVDIVETGTTLKENNLEVIDTVSPISARLIANKSAFQFKRAQIERISEAMQRITEELK